MEKSELTLSKEQIEEMREFLGGRSYYKPMKESINALCDLALRSLPSEGQEKAVFQAEDAYLRSDAHQLHAYGKQLNEPAPHDMLPAVTEEMVRTGAEVIAASPSIDAPKLPADCWMAYRGTSSKRSCAPLRLRQWPRGCRSLPSMLQTMGALRCHLTHIGILQMPTTPSAPHTPTRCGRTNVSAKRTSD